MVDTLKGKGVKPPEPLRANHFLSLVSIKLIETSWNTRKTNHFAKCMLVNIDKLKKVSWTRKIQIWLTFFLKIISDPFHALERWMVPPIKNVLSVWEVKNIVYTIDTYLERYIFMDIIEFLSFIIVCKVSKKTLFSKIRLF